MNDGLTLPGRVVERRTHEGRLARARFADKHGEPGARRQAVPQVRECLTMLPGQKEEAWVRRKLKRPLPQSVVLFIHGYCNSLHASAAQTAPAAMKPDNRAATRRRLSLRGLGVTGIVPRTGRFSAARTSSSDLMVRSKNSANPANANPMASADVRASRYSRGRSGLAGFSGTRAGSTILNCSPIWRRSRLAEICESSFLASSA